MEKIKLLLYCTKSKPDLVREEKELYEKGLTGNNKYNTYNTNEIGSCGYTLNGKIVAECDFEVEEIAIHRTNVAVGFDTTYYTENMEIDKLMQYSCLNSQDLENYLGTKKDNGEKVGYAIRIKNLNIFDKPRKLSCYSTYTKEIINTWWFYLNHKIAKKLEKAPQNMMYCYGNNTGEKYILISIRPEWLCKILNGEKTIEIRRKVLKEMVK